VRSETPGAAVVSDEAVKLTDVSEEISELISEIGERYGMGSLITARRFSGGYANDVFRLDADRPPTVLHLKHPPVDADSLNWEHRLLAQLNSHLPEALAPVPALDGSTWFWFHDRPVWLTRGLRASVPARTTGTLSPRC
jgi:Ser/Thr protein kinase RdoA (MazF antagonist)